MKLYNQLSNDQQKALLEEAGEDRLTLSFYQYFKIEDPKSFRDKLYRAWDDLGVLGRTYVASEGINSQISLPAPQLDNFRKHLYSIDDALNDIRLNVAIEQDNMSFLKLKMKVRDKSVADGLEDDEEVGDDFESMYKGEISKSGTPILPSKRARKTPEKIQVAPEDLEELTAKAEPEVEVNPELEVDSNETEVSLDQIAEIETAKDSSGETEPKSKYLISILLCIHYNPLIFLPLYKYL